jgi:cysteine desulfurase
MPRIYLDFNASTPIASEVAEVVGPFLTSEYVGYGNPSSAHWAGEPARRAVEHARAEVAALIEASPEEVVFTSGGTEANNAALKGVFFKSAARTHSPHIITTAIEHPAVLEPCRFLQRLGAQVTRLPVDSTGLVDPEHVRDAITPDTVLVSVMHANNEVGTVEPIAEIAAITRDRGIPLHCDAAQSVGKIPTRVQELGVDLLSIAGHKLYAPKGVGALYVRSGCELEPFMHGAGHERGRRAGTESALLAVGLGAACRLAKERPCADRVASLTTYFRDELTQLFGSRAVFNGHSEHCLPNTLNVSFPGHLGQDVLAGLNGVAASTGSACHTGSPSMSPVLEAMGVDEVVGLGAVRFSLGRQTERAEIDMVIEQLGALNLFPTE